MAIDMLLLDAKLVLNEQEAATVHVCTSEEWSLLSGELASDPSQGHPDSGEDIDIDVSSSQTKEVLIDNSFFFANQGRRCPKLTGVGASTVFTRYCWEYFNLPIEPIPLQLDCKASELHCFPHLGTNQRPPQSNLEVLVKFCTNFSPVQLYDVGAGAVKKSNVP
ncbi:unnamed protein product [Brassica oleracea var. botrytis]|uniref:Uncharacterized protein n=1 Tax=Brassica oleracea TaxID=3712 RepID=A0A3P6FJ35_BRAOL|nr:unnamed protein product [Brassica oleracea]